MAEKYYVIWKGKETGVFHSWSEVKERTIGYQGAQYKSFINKKEAQKAFKEGYKHYKRKESMTVDLRNSKVTRRGSPIKNSLTVDAACSGNPGKVEYRGVLNHNQQELFRKGPYKSGTNNIGEFLALVHGIALLKNTGLHKMPIYSDSKTAISWVKKKKCKTTLVFDSSNRELFELIARAENWLNSHTFTNSILKWETKAWGEIPADFGRK